jgi:hypothetical protein
MKRGLKVSKPPLLATITFTVEEYSPMKRGLKGCGIFTAGARNSVVEEYSPMKRGLKVPPSDP